MTRAQCPAAPVKFPTGACSAICVVRTGLATIGYSSNPVPCALRRLVKASFPYESDSKKKPASGSHWWFVVAILSGRTGTEPRRSSARAARPPCPLPRRSTPSLPSHSAHPCRPASCPPLRCRLARGAAVPLPYRCPRTPGHRFVLSLCCSAAVLLAKSSSGNPSPTSTRQRQTRQLFFWPSGTLVHKTAEFCLKGVIVKKDG